MFQSVEEVIEHVASAVTMTGRLKGWLEWEASRGADLDVLALLGRGLSETEVATAAWVSANTVCELTPWETSRHYGVDLVVACRAIAKAHQKVGGGFDDASYTRRAAIVERELTAVAVATHGDEQLTQTPFAGLAELLSA